MDQNLPLFDTIIVGGGPAGIAASVYAVRKALKVLLVTENIGGQAAWSGDIENYPGFSLITGADLSSKFREEVKRFEGQGLWVKEGVRVAWVDGKEGDFRVKSDERSSLSGSGDYRGKTVIIASGRKPRFLSVPGEKEFFGKGVTTCATCDGPLYKGKDVVVVGGGNSALDAAFSLMKVCRSVTIVNITQNVLGDEILIKNVTGASNVKILNNSSVVEIIGKNTVEGVKIQDKQAHQVQDIPCRGVFIEIGYTPSVDFIPQAAKDKQNCIIVDEFGQSSVPGIWAAGDVNNLWGEQIVIAAGEGAKVALSVAEHLSKLPHQSTSNIHMG